MKKSILLFLLSLFVIQSAEAQAQEWFHQPWNEGSCCIEERNFYAKILGGANFLQNSAIDGNTSTYKTGYLISGSLGYRWCYGLRFEAEYAFRRNAINKMHFYVEGFSKDGYCQASSYMANLLWDLPLSFWGCAFWNIQPFVGAGIGYDFQKMHSSNSRIVFKQKWHQFSWQAMAGLSYPLFCNTAVSLEYQLHQSRSHFHDHSIGIGLYYKFGL